MRRGDDPTLRALLAPAPDDLAPMPAFTNRERRLISRLNTPLAVQKFLNALRYNKEDGGATLRTFRGVVRENTAHCLEAALFAATVLEQHGYPPLLMSLQSIDLLDHVLFVFRHHGRWGTVARSRDPGLHGRKPLFRGPRELALSYVDPYVDFTGGLFGYGMYDLRWLGSYDWRLSARNAWLVERVLIDLRHRAMPISQRRVDELRARYRAFRAAHPGTKPVDYPRRERWTELPRDADSAL